MSKIHLLRPFRATDEFCGSPTQGVALGYPIAALQAAIVARVNDGGWNKEARN
jgi:hypothetical protein